MTNYESVTCDAVIAAGQRQSDGHTTPLGVWDATLTVPLVYTCTTLNETNIDI